MQIVFNKNWSGHARGDRVDVDDQTGRMLIKAGYAHKKNVQHHLDDLAASGHDVAAATTQHAEAALELASVPPAQTPTDSPSAGTDEKE